MPRKQPAKKTAPEKHPGGRPSAYRDEFAEHARKLCLLGATDAQLGEFFGVSEQTINAWKVKHETFASALRRGKLEADAAVAQSLYNEAIGGNVTACIFWLKNRQKEHWRDKHEMEHGATETFASLVAQAFGTPDA